MSSMSSMSSSEPPLKKAKVEHEPDGPFGCPFCFESCRVRAKSNGNITQHKAFKHDIGVDWKQCNHCDYKAKANSDITRHKADKHGIGVNWKQCLDCDYKAKESGTLNNHIKRKHPSLSKRRVK